MKSDMLQEPATRESFMPRKPRMLGVKKSQAKLMEYTMASDT